MARSHEEQEQEQSDDKGELSETQRSAQELDEWAQRELDDLECIRILRRFLAGESIDD